MQWKVGDRVTDAQSYHKGEGEIVEIETLAQSPNRYRVFWQGSNKRTWVGGSRLAAPSAKGEAL